jgi:tetratricopeptide (TPR) repeat protein
VRLQPDEGIHHFNVFCGLVALGRYHEAKNERQRTIESGLMLKGRFNASADKYVSDTLNAGLSWHPSGSRPKGPAFLAMQESAETYQQLAKKARRVVSDGFCPTWSPDGTELAYAGGILGFTGIEVLDLASGKTRLLTVPGLNPAWSPDGRFIAFERTRKPLLLADVARKHEMKAPGLAQREVWLIRADGSEDPRFLALGMCPSWSSDPSRVFYKSMQDQKLYSISIQGGKPVPLVQCRGIFPVVSPDGRHVAGIRSNGRPGILDLTSGSVVAEMRPKGPFIFAEPLIFADWSRNGRELSAASGDSGLWIYELDPSMQVTKASKVLSGSFGRSGWPRSGIGRLAIQRMVGGYYREIWVADLDPNQSAAESLGPGRTLEEHYQEMIDLYTRRIEIDPEDPEHYLPLAGTYIETGDKEKALEIFDVFKKRVKNSSWAAEAYGLAGLSEIRDDPKFAMELYHRAHKLQPGNWYYLWGLGVAHFLMGQIDQATAKYTESMKLPGGENSLNYFSLAIAHGRRGNKEEATRWYEKAMKQMPADRSSQNVMLLTVLDIAHAQASTLLGIKTEEETP